MDIVRELQMLAASAGIVGDFGLGSPNEMPPFLALFRFVWELFNWVVKRHGYAPQNGMLETREAVAAYNRDVYGVTLDPNKHILILEGSRGGCVFVMPRGGDVVLPIPFYPGHLDAVRENGCNPVFVPMKSVEGFINELEKRLRDDRHFRPCMVIFSPENPCWLPRTRDDLERLCDLAREFGFLALFDEAYTELAYDGTVVSAVQVPGFMGNAIVLKTASKPYGVAGWKIGVAITSKDRIASMTARKSVYSEGGSPAAQLAYATALTWCRSFPAKLARRYYRRADLTVNLLRSAGIKHFKRSGGGMFLDFAVEGDCEEFARELARQGVLVRPGTCFGEPGYIRWCLRESDKTTRKACAIVADVVRCRRETDDREREAADILQ